jgi:glyoxylase-like metal-dependent hydrolase (beta-lactamase superfamily II)
MRQNRTPLLLLLLLLLLLFTLPAQAKITFGVVPNVNSGIRLEKESDDLTDYLAGQLSEEVLLQTFSDEKSLHYWLNRYRMVDLAILSDSYLASQPPGEFFPLADLVLRRSVQATVPQLIVARQGLNPWLLQKLQRILLTMGYRPTGREILKGLGVLAIVPRGSRPEGLADELPSLPATPVEPNPLPPTEPVADIKATEFIPAPLAAEPNFIAASPPTKFSDPVHAAAPPPAAETNTPTPFETRELPRRGEALLEIPSHEGKGERTKSGTQASYRVDQIADGIYAAITNPGGNATSNAFFVVGTEYVVAGGAHMTQKAIDDLVTAIRTVTDKPWRYFILAHHHAGYSHVDFDFPLGVDLIISWQTRKAMDEEVRKLNRPTLFYSDGLTLKLGEQTIILTNMGRAHTEGDTLVFFPEAEVLFTSDLVYVNSIGYMGDGHMEDWLLALEFIERLGAKKIVPGFGPISTTKEITRFKKFFREMVTEVLSHLEQNDSLEQTVKTFSLPEYSSYSGYEQFIRINVRRAYTDLKENFMD